MTIIDLGPLGSYQLAELAGRVLSVVAVIVAALLVYLLGRIVIGRSARPKYQFTQAVSAQSETARSLLLSSWRYAVSLVAIFALLTLLPGGFGQAVTFTGLVGVILVLAALTLFRDVIAGFSVLLEGQYAVGDRVRLFGPDVEGTVEGIGLRLTVVREERGTRVFVPNGSVSAVRVLSGAAAPEDADRRQRERGGGRGRGGGRPRSRERSDEAAAVVREAATDVEVGPATTEAGSAERSGSRGRRGGRRRGGRGRSGERSREGARGEAGGAPANQRGQSRPSGGGRGAQDAGARGEDAAGSPARDASQTSPNGSPEGTPEPAPAGRPDRAERPSGRGGRSSDRPDRSSEGTGEDDRSSQRRGRPSGRDDRASDRDDRTSAREDRTSGGEERSDSSPQSAESPSESPWSIE